MAFLLQLLSFFIKKNWVFLSKMLENWEFGNKNSVFTVCFLVFLSPDWSEALQMVSKRLRGTKTQFCQVFDLFFFFPSPCHKKRPSVWQKLSFCWQDVKISIAKGPSFFYFESKRWWLRWAKIHWFSRRKFQILRCDHLFPISRRRKI